MSAASRTDPRPPGLEPAHPAVTLDADPYPGPGGAAETQPDGRSAPPAAPITVPGYEVYRPLGEGGMGVVYLARQVALDRLVALKTLHAAGGSAAAQARVRQEAAVLAKLSHPNVVQVYEVGEAGGRTFFALELVPGGTLADRLRAGPLAPRAAAALVGTLTAALDATHRVGLIHCDLKPANVLLAADGTPKVADFGLARRFDDADGRTRTGSICGTPSYMAPEQAAGRLGEYGPPVDVYALGGILYALLTGRPPFLADNVLDTLRQVEEQDPVSPRRLNPAVPADLETVCLKCLEKAPAKRYPTAAALGDDLARFLADEPITARPPGRLGTAARWCRRNPSRAALLAVCFAGMGVTVGAAALVHRQQTRDLSATLAARDDARANSRAARRALVHQAAERIDGELRGLAGRPQAVAAAVEVNPAVDEAFYRDWLGRLVAAAADIHGLCLALEPAGGTGFALLVQRGPGGLVARRLDREPLDPPYHQRPWFTSAGGWGEPYLGTDAGRTPMVTFTAPVRRGGRAVGVVTLDVATDRLQSLRDDLRALIPDVEDISTLTTATGTVLLHPEAGRPSSAAVSDGDEVVTATLPGTGWTLAVAFPPEGR